MPVAFSKVRVTEEKPMPALNCGFVSRRLFPVELFPLPVGPRRMALSGFRAVGVNKHNENVRRK